MNFFEQQDLARKNTRSLLLLFFLSLVCIIILANILLVFVPFDVSGGSLNTQGANSFLSCISDVNCRVVDHLPWSKIAFISIAISTIILMASAYKSLSLSKSGGAKVAELLGGEALDLNSETLLDKRLFNVVQEMSLAANMPPPTIYVLREEEGINAFAAGYSNNDAVIAVTQGLLDSLDRDQLQAVVAHEFSHIVHGDCVLNMRLLSIVYGLLCLSEIGFFMFRLTGWGRRRRYGYSSHRSSYSSSSIGSNRKGKGGGQAILAYAAVGITLIVVGYIGVFFGNLIKSAVSRQREYLADASAVKYTRHPDAVADALKIILAKGARSKGSYVDNAHAGEMSHFFFSKSVNQLQSLFSTHPKLIERIYRVQPNWDGDTTTKSSIANVRRKAREHSKAEKAAKQQEKKSNQQFEFDLEASTLVAALMMANKQEEQQDDAILAVEKQANMSDEEQAEVTLYAEALTQLKPLLTQPLSAVSIILELLISLQFQHLDDAQRQKPLENLRQIAHKHWPALQAEWEKIQSIDFSAVVSNDALKLVELCVPALRQLRKDEYSLFKKLLAHCIKSDEKVDVLEWCLHQFIISLLDGVFDFKKPASAKYQRANQVEESITVLLHLLIGSNAQAAVEKDKVFAKSCDKLGFYSLSATPPDWDKLPTLTEFSAANAQMKLAYSLLKGKVINIAKHAAMADGDIEPIERQILLTLAASWEVPMPDAMFEHLNLVSM